MGGGSGSYTMCQELDASNYHQDRWSNPTGEGVQWCLDPFPIDSNNNNFKYQRMINGLAGGCYGYGFGILGPAQITLTMSGCIHSTTGMTVHSTKSQTMRLLLPRDSFRATTT